MNEPIQVNFYDTIPEERVKFAVIISRYHGKLLWVKHKMRDTWEFPGGHREKENRKNNIVSWSGPQLCPDQERV